MKGKTRKKEKKEKNPQSRSTAQRIFEKQTSSLLQSLKELNFSHSLRRGELFDVRVFHVFSGIALKPSRRKKKEKKEKEKKKEEKNSSFIRFFEVFS